MDSEKSSSRAYRRASNETFVRGWNWLAFKLRTWGYRRSSTYLRNGRGSRTLSLPSLTRNLTHRFQSQKVSLNDGDSDNPRESDFRHVSLVELKALARRLLPRNSILQTIILSEPDFLPREVALAKVEICVKLLYKETLQTWSMLSSLKGYQGFSYVAKCI